MSSSSSPIRGSELHAAMTKYTAHPEARTARARGIRNLSSSRERDAHSSINHESERTCRPRTRSKRRSASTGFFGGPRPTNESQRRRVARPVNVLRGLVGPRIEQIEVLLPRDEAARARLVHLRERSVGARSGSDEPVSEDMDGGRRGGIAGHAPTLRPGAHPRCHAVRRGCSASLAETRSEPCSVATTATNDATPFLLHARYTEPSARDCVLRARYTAHGGAAT